MATSSRARLVAACLIVVAAFGGDAAHGTSMMSSARIATTSSPQESANWSGYVALAPPAGAVSSASAQLTFTDVTGSWRQPTAHCDFGRGAAAAFWVGIGGSSADSATLQQIGTTAQCGSNGMPAYFVWWEIVPAAEVRVPLRVRPGDRITAAVLVRGTKVTMSLKNLTRRTRFSKTVTAAQPLDVSSAEWIAEAPSVCTLSGACQVIPLSNFGSVTFSNATATANEVSGTITDPAWLATPVRLVPDETAGGSGAVPGPLAADGRSFSISWQRPVVRNAASH
jgi:peptidase A4-like protein